MTESGRRPLHEHIASALTAMATRLVHAYPDHAAELADWLADAHRNVLVTATVDTTRTGRVDTRSYTLHVHLRTEAGIAPLCTVRRRHLHVPPDIASDDPQAECRTLLLQLGYGVPDDLSTLDEPR